MLLTRQLELNQKYNSVYALESIFVSNLAIFSSFLTYCKHLLRASAYSAQTTAIPIFIRELSELSSNTQQTEYRINQANAFASALHTDCTALHMGEHS